MAESSSRGGTRIRSPVYERHPILPLSEFIIGVGTTKPSMSLDVATVGTNRNR
jgi:hypothetical protein